MLSVFYPQNFKIYLTFIMWLSGKESACNRGDTGFIPGSGRFPGEGNGNPFQYSCLENPMDGGVWWATVHRVANSQTRLSEWLNDLVWIRQVNILFNFQSSIQPSFIATSCVPVSGTWEDAVVCCGSDRKGIDIWVGHLWVGIMASLLVIMCS